MNGEPRASYGQLLRLPRALPLLASATVGRLMYGIMPVGLLLLMAERRHSYADAASIVATYSLAAGVLGPARARLVDRSGARLVLPALAAGLTGAVALLAIFSTAPLPLVLALALLAGCLPPPVGPLMRASWCAMVDGDDAMVRRAYSLDSASEEVMFVVGPVMATIIAAWLSPEAVSVGAAAMLLVSAASLARALPRTSAGSAGAREVSHKLGRDAHFLSNLAPIAGLGFVLGTLEVAAIAAALKMSQNSLAGLPSGAVACGSVIGGLIYGRRVWPGSATQQARAFAVVVSLFAVIAGLLTTHFQLMTVALLFVGLGSSPGMVAAYVVADERSPITGAEATSWVNSTFNVALALGVATSGVVFDAFSAQWAMAAGAAGAIVIAFLPSIGRRSGEAVSPQSEPIA